MLIPTTQVAIPSARRTTSHARTLPIDSPRLASSAFRAKHSQTAETVIDLHDRMATAPAGPLARLATQTRAASQSAGARVTSPGAACCPALSSFVQPEHFAALSEQADCAAVLPSPTPHPRSRMAHGSLGSETVTYLRTLRAVSIMNRVCCILGSFSNEGAAGRCPRASRPLRTHTGALLVDRSA